MKLCDFFCTTALVAISYFCLGEIGLIFAIPPGYASAIFPASAFAVVVSLHVGLRGLPGIWFGSFAINICIAHHNHSVQSQDYFIAASIGFGAVFQSWIAKTLVQFRINDAWQRLEHDRDIITFLFLTGPVSCLISSGWAMLTLMAFKVINLQELTFTWWNWWTGDALGVLLFTPILLNFLFREQLCWHSRLKSVVIPTLFLALITFATYILASENENRLINFRIDGYGQSIASSINQKLLAYTETLGALASLFTINPNVTRSDFEVFVQPILHRHDDVHALSWNPLIKHAQRQTFETEFGLEYNQTTFEIYERDKQGKQQSASSREWYVPVGYIAPLKSNQKALGYDIASNHERLTAIHAAIESSELVATPPIRLVQDDNQHVGLLIVQPVYSKNEKYSGLPIGFAVGVFKVEEMLRNLIGQNLPEKLGFILEDLNVEGTSQSIIYDAPVNNIKDSSLFNWSRTMIFAGRQWQLTIYPSTEFLVKERSLFAWSILATGIIITSLLQAMLLGISGRTFAIQRRVDEQTREITDQSQKLHNHQEFLAREKDKYEKLLHASGDGVHILDFHGRAVEVNQKFCDMLGYKHDEVIGMHVSKWNVLDSVLVMMQVRDNFGQANVFETQHLRKDGQIIDVEVSAKALIISGQLLLWNASRDISERKQMQIALIQAKEAAEQATELKSRFLANMSHEVRTPMNGIIGLSELALNLPSTPELHDYLQKIATSSHSLLGILNDILDFSKIEAQRIAIEEKPFNLIQVIDNLKSLFEHHATSKQLEFRISLDSNIPPILIGDNLRLQQILSNLTGNAIKFTEQGSVCLSVHLIKEDGPIASIQFKIEDTGIGISAEQQSRLFKAFSQGDDSITRRFGGTGLGLVISENLLEMMGSKFTVVSEPNKGCSFSFIINFQIPENHEVITGDEYHNKFEVGGLKKMLNQKADVLKDSQILIVEDNRINQYVVKGFLTLAGVKVSLANNGEEALEQIKMHNFNAILMDVHMPVMDGLEATRQIRENQLFKDLPIIALTAGVTPEERKTCLSSGMNDLVSKPVNSNELIAVLCRWI